MMGAAAIGLRRLRARGSPRPSRRSCRARGRCGWRRGRRGCRRRRSRRRTRRSSPHWRSCGRRRAAPASASRSAGTLPPCCSISARDRAMTFFAFMLNRPIVLMCRFSPSSPSASICSRRVDRREQVSGREVDAGVGRLGGEHDRDQQRVVVDEFELGLRVAACGRAAAGRIRRCRPSSSQRVQRARRAGPSPSSTISVGGADADPEMVGEAEEAAGHDRRVEIARAAARRAHRRRRAAGAGRR